MVTVLTVIITATERYLLYWCAHTRRNTHPTYLWPNA